MMNNQTIEAAVQTAFMQYLTEATKVAFDLDIEVKADFNEVKDQHKDLDLRVKISYRPKL